MAFKKVHLFDPADQLTSSFARALGHPVRLDILRFLEHAGSSSVEKISIRYPLAKSTVSDHLEKLRKADLVQYKEKYPYIYYRLDKKNFKKCRVYLRSFCSKFK